MTARRRATIVLSLIVAAGCATALVVYDEPGAARGPVNPVAMQTAKVEQTALKLEQTYDGTLEYGNERPLLGEREGRVTALTEEGASLKRGQVVFRVDDEPTFLFYGRTPFYRDLEAGDEGPDVRVLELNLSAMGYEDLLDGSPDEQFDYRTGRALAQWQDDHNVEETGVLHLGDAVVAEGAIRVARSLVSVGQSVTPGAESASVTDTSAVVTAQVPLAGADGLAKGTVGAVTLPDGRSARARLTRVAAVEADPGAGGTGSGGGSDELEAEFVLRSVDLEPQWQWASAEVRVVRGTRKDALVVPVEALAARLDGTYAVEVVEGDRTRLVSVELGAFAQGLVEVSGRGLRKGTEVVVAQ